ncbi:hypothetical protein AB0H82_30580 [Streptomyces sp. NPDC050732]|uniref:hypothetical protein n=1 Tax=Streptomyces sp. NPDC050732 TaxID=3154632 RepID=UPI0034272DA0
MVDEELDPGGLASVQGIGRRIGLALESARLYRHQRQVAETRECCPLPQLADAPHVCGDWYIAFAIPGGETALGIGDVVGTISKPRWDGAAPHGDPAPGLSGGRGG